MKTVYCRIGYYLPKSIDFIQRTAMFTVENETDALAVLQEENLWKETRKVAALAGGLNNLTITFTFGNPVDDHHLEEPKKTHNG